MKKMPRLKWVWPPITLLLKMVLPTPSHCAMMCPGFAGTQPHEEVVTVKDCEGNDRYVTAQDFEYSIKRIADPETAAGYAFLLGWVVAGR